MANEGYHEPAGESGAALYMHGAVVSLMEEREAVDWYNQRVDPCNAPELRAIPAHDCDEEKKHAAVVLEWIRRGGPRLDHELRSTLFTETRIAPR